MAYVSTIYPAKVWMLAQLTSALAASGARVRWGAPTEGEDLSGALVYMGAPLSPRDEYLVLGADRTDETYELPVVVDVRKYGDNEQATEQLAWQLMGQVVTIVDTDPRFGGAVNRTPAFTFLADNQVSGPKQWRTVIEVRFQVVGLVYT
jgi:hypothetical protein